MTHLYLSAAADIRESLRARWFLVYSLVFGGVIVALFVTGLTESRVMGFTGLSRMLVTYLQITMAILPVFVLLTTVRSVAGDREAGVFEYMLSLPVSLSSWYWGKFVGRLAIVIVPVIGAMLLAVLWGLVVRHAEVPWRAVLFYTGLLFSLAWCFLGIGMLISSLVRSSELAQGVAFVVWLVLLLFLDLILLGLLVQEGMQASGAITLALLNPLQVFRTASMLLFDPQLVLLGPAAYVILDHFSETGYLLYALCYPVFLGLLSAGLGYLVFRRSDLP